MRREHCWWVATGILLAGLIAPDLSAQVGAPPVPFMTDAPKSITQLPPVPIVPSSLGDLKAIQTRVEAVVKTAMPATVAILLDDAQGSGVIVSRDGYVLTAGHVSGTPGQLMEIVLSNGLHVQAKAIGANNNIDSGMVKITTAPPPGGFPFVPLGTAKDLKSGQWVVAMGHPGGFREDRPPVVRLGRVLLANRAMIGTDCPLISGDSGGPLFDLDGRLIGINSRIGATTTANIHVPIDTFETTWGQLAKGQEWGGTRALLAGRGEEPAAPALPLESPQCRMTAGPSSAKSKPEPPPKSPACARAMSS